MFSSAAFMMKALITLDPTFRTLTVTHQQKADLVVFMN